MWPQSVVWLPRASTRLYGALESEIHDAFGVAAPDGRVPLLLHPQAPGAHRELGRVHGRALLPDVRSTPTSSYRTVLAWRPGRAPVMLKLSIGAIVSRLRRRLRENQVARGVIMSALFETVPEKHRAALGFDWCADSAGMVETMSGHGWLLRHFPRRLAVDDGLSFVPAFSLISMRGEQPPYLVDLIKRSGLRPETFVIESMLRRYVEASAYLLFVQALYVEAHTQNVLYEVDASGGLTGRFAIRDLSDTSVSIPLRLARRKALPVLPNGFLPAGAPFPLASVATDYVCNFDRPTLFRAFDTVEVYGLWGFVWAINTVLVGWFSSYDAASVVNAYLELWQEACTRYLGVRPLFRPDPHGLATDEAIAYFLRHTDWTSLGATPGHALPDAVEALLVGGRSRRRTGPVYGRVETAWGDLFLDEGHPAFFRPAF